MDASEGHVGELYEIRFSGSRWRIAMRAAEYQLFCSGISADAHLRLRSAFQLFCQQGSDPLPAPLFRKLPGAERCEAFVAFGVQVIGRRATEDPLKTFYVTEMRCPTDVALVETALAAGQLPLSFMQS